MGTSWLPIIIGVGSTFIVTSLIGLIICIVYKWKKNRDAKVNAIMPTTFNHAAAQDKIKADR